jgi:Protein of unknown function (DUF732)
MKKYFALPVFFLAFATPVSAGITLDHLPTNSELQYLYGMRHMAEVQEEPIIPVTDDAQLLRLGYSVCGALDSGAPIRQVMATAERQLFSQLSVEAAIPTLCPQYSTIFTRYLAGVQR